MEECQLQLMTGIDIPVPSCRLVLHQPKVREIAFLGEHNFFIAVQTLSVNKSMISQGETLLADTSNFQIFMTIMTEKETADKRTAVSNLFALVLPDYKITYLPSSLLLSKEGETVAIDEHNFDDFQEAIKMIFCTNNSPMNQTAFNPADDRAREIANKIMRSRAIVASQKGEGQASIFSQYLSSLTIGAQSMSLQDCMELTMYQLFDLVERYMLYVNWDIDIRAKLAGSTNDKQPENWMKNIH